MADENGSQLQGFGEAIPRLRIQALSDLIFGLALSIGALTLLTQKPATVIDLAISLLGFGWAFIILALVWVRYTKIMSVLPVETGKIVGANVLLLFLVSIEPYLYNLIGISVASLPGRLDSGITTALYAADMGSIFLIIAYFTHQLTVEEKKLVPSKLLASYRLQRNATAATATIFLVSALPIFWTLALFGFQLRFILWMCTFVAWGARRVLEGRLMSSSITS